MNKPKIDRRIFEYVVPHCFVNRMARNFAWNIYVLPHAENLSDSDKPIIDLHPHFYTTRKVN